MKSFFNTAATATVLLVAFTSQALANGGGFLPEPGSVGLAVIGIAAAAYFLKKGKGK